ncbi:MAG: glycine betaine/L-proline ABC transporter ATP-binding protein, partial [Caldilinea sp.]|nr:glycine betaine/L-proline ABC transporter ATP-binding protein [Caldilinea sp.]
IADTVTPEMTRREVLERTGHVLAVRDVSFEVYDGEIFVVMGLSGSGKSTLIRCLSRLIEPTRGTIVVNGADVTGLSEGQLRELRRHTMSMVFQRFGLFSHRRVIDNVAYGLEVQGMPKEQRLARSQEILELVGLHGWEHHYPHELSGGMQQRVGLARALAVDPEILLCDEPFSALDPLIRRDMQNELIRLQTNLRKTLVFITHDFLEAIKLGDRIAIMKDGEIVQIGTPEQIVAHPVNDYVREFTKDVPRVKVLTARSVMKPVHDKAALIGKAIAIDTTLEALIPLTVDSDQDVPIVDEQQNLVGLVDRKAVMLALANTIVEIGESVE